MKRLLLHTLLLLSVLLISAPVVQAREGDTLEPIEIDAPALQTWPEQLLNSDDERLIEQRVSEARNSGVPVAIRIVDMSQPTMDIPFQMRQFAELDYSQPFSADLQQEILAAWRNSEKVETSDRADDGFVLLVLVPKDRTQTQAMWWIGPNALPINGLTHENIQATQSVMQEQFAAGNMPNGIYLGISEFSYNIQFGEPERETRTTLQDALHWAVLPLAIGIMVSGIGVPILAFLLARKNTTATTSGHELTPWEAAALYQGRVRQNIPAAMLLEEFHQGSITPLASGELQLESSATGPTVEALRPFANADGVVSRAAVAEIEGICLPVRQSLENTLASIGAYTRNAYTDRTWMLLAIGLTAFLTVLGVVPTVVSMSTIGAYAIAVGVIGILIGWWWLSYRSYTTPGGTILLASWLENASATERHLFDTAVQQHLLIESEGGPDVSTQSQLIRTFRGVGAG